MRTLLAIAISLAAPPETEDGDKTPTVSETVAVMNSLFVKREFGEFYKTQCHKHLRDQVDEQEFIECMKGKDGAAILNLFSEVLDAIKQQKGEDVLIARPQDDPDEYEFILVQVRDSRSRGGRQWHLELKKEDGRWKLMDTD